MVLGDLQRALRLTACIVVSTSSACSVFSGGESKDPNPPLAPELVSITGLQNSTTPLKSVTWNWDCGTNTPPCSFRYAIDTSAYSEPSGVFLAEVTSATLGTGNGTVYLHAQARDAAGNVSRVVHVSAVLDNLAPSVTGLNSTTTPVVSQTFSWGCNEPPCTYRSAIDQNPANTDLGALTYTSSNTRNSSGSTTNGAGFYFIHVQARDAAGNQSAVAHASFVILDSFSLAGTATYDWIPAQPSGGLGGTEPRLNYSAKQARPIRRARIAALNATNTNIILAQSVTDDLGRFGFTIASGQPVRLRVYAQMLADNAQPLFQFRSDQTAPNHCRDGTQWDVKVVDNTSIQLPTYVFTSNTTFSTNNSAVAVHAPTDFANGAYVTRAGAPFALLDTAASAIETVCQGDPGGTVPPLTFSPLTINWSINNTAIAGDPLLGEITTTSFVYDPNAPSANSRKIFVLGEAGVDTDEYDDHVIAHEFSHYLENALYRSDSLGGSHALADSLDPRVAFSEGLGNAFSGMTFRAAGATDPQLYIDTTGASQNEGSVVDLDVAPVMDNPVVPTGSPPDSGLRERSIFSERAIQHVLWRLFEDLRTSTSAPTQRPFSRFHSVLAEDLRPSPAFTTMLTFGAHYNQRYTGIASLWRAHLAPAQPGADPFNALCSGACSEITLSGSLADPFDVNNDLGNAYSLLQVANPPPRVRYPARNGHQRTPAFWQLYPAVTLGTVIAAPSAPNPTPSTFPHNVTDDGNNQLGTDAYSYKFNKMGMSRWYRYTHVGPNAQVTVRIPNYLVRTSATGGFVPGTCATSTEPTDAHDLWIYDRGASLRDIGLGSCPAVSFTAVQGRTYLIDVRGYARDATYFSLIVSSP